ncbi:patatin-like phospholipase family protein [Streptosporangiaceae bacterium NEAU-GS5]|nr:patatin-like phospholipase family protein [Streptosporangiaceae bacterium NEAU-GS5]
MSPDPSYASTLMELSKYSAYWPVSTGMGMPPNRAAESGEHAAAGTGVPDPKYVDYVNHSCDLTMQGGVTSGVIYPFAVCALARTYVFRSIGGASVGAMAAAATAAAEYGRRTAAKTEGEVSDGHVRAGFPGLAQMVESLLSPPSRDEEYRLAQLFQPGRKTRALYRVVIASKQSRGTTRKSPIRCLTAALVGAIGWRSRAATFLLLTIWLAVPTLLAGLLDGDAWASAPRWIHTGLPMAALLLLASLLAAAVAFGVRAEQNVPADPDRKDRFAPTVRRWLGRIGMAAVVVFPLVLATGNLIFRGPVRVAPSYPATTFAFIVCAWLVLTVAAVTAIGLVYAIALKRFLDHNAAAVHFGLLPGTVDKTEATSGIGAWANRVLDRWAGVPKPRGIPPLADWLADRIDDLAGRPAGPDDPPLTFGDLWAAGLDVSSSSEYDTATLGPGARAIDLALIATDLTQGRPYRLPFEKEEEGWLFCEDCLKSVLPDRVVDWMTTKSESSGLRCPAHPSIKLRALPESRHLPIVVTARMSLSFPGLIAAVPLVLRNQDDEPVIHWFSDGGITSNFPIHFFDTLFPLWPTFGLDIQPRRNPGGDDVYLPEQTAEPARLMPVTIAGVTMFLSAIFNTFQSWRDTLQSELPGFRGRIAHVRQSSSEGGMNLFMSSETIRALAARGYKAGVALEERFRDKNNLQARWYRWLRMRIAVEKLSTAAMLISRREPTYSNLVRKIPSDAPVDGWFICNSPTSDTFGGALADQFAAFIAPTPQNPTPTQDGFELPDITDLRLIPRA